MSTSRISGHASLAGPLTRQVARAPPCSQPQRRQRLARSISSPAPGARSGAIHRQLHHLLAAVALSSAAATQRDGGARAQSVERIDLVAEHEHDAVALLVHALYAHD